MIKALIPRLIVALTLIAFAAQSEAADVSIGTKREKSNSRSQELNQRGSNTSDRAMEVTLTLDSVFLPVIADMERTNKAFRGCKVVSKPLMPADLGVSSARSGGYDLIAGAVLQQQSMSSGVAPNQARLMKYRNCMAFYAASIAQAHHILSEMLPVEAIGIDDLKTLATIALEKGQTVPFAGNIKQGFDMITADKTPCRYNGALDKYRCGLSMIDLSAQTLMLGSTEYYTAAKFAGVAGTYKVSQSSARSREFVMSQKMAWDKSKSSATNVSPSQHMPK